jgi:hypothetical protein
MEEMFDLVESCDVAGRKHASFLEPPRLLSFTKRICDERAYTKFTSSRKLHILISSHLVPLFILFVVSGINFFGFGGKPDYFTQLL